MARRKEPAAFRERRQEDTERAERNALRLAWLVAHGLSVPDAARHVGVSERTGWRYLKTARARGQAGR